MLIISNSILWNTSEYPNIICTNCKIGINLPLGNLAYIDFANAFFSLMAELVILLLWMNCLSALKATPVCGSAQIMQRLSLSNLYCSQSWMYFHKPIIQLVFSCTYTHGCTRNHIRIILTHLIMYCKKITMLQCWQRRMKSST